MTACAPEELTTTFEGDGRTLSLSFKLDDSSSRVVAEDVVNSSEVKITRADIFVYKNDDTFYFKENGVTPSEMTYNDTHKHYECTAKIQVPSDFEAGDYKIYVVANSDVATDGLTNKLVNPTSTSLADLQGLAFESALETLISTDTRFIMDGVADVKVGEKNVVDEEIVLTRAAAKIVLDLSVYSSITASDNNTYTPVLYSGTGNSQVSNIKVSFHNGLKTYNYQTPETFATSKWTGEPGDATNTTPSVYPIAIDPFYTYPVEWEPSSETEPFLMLEIPWKVSTDGDNADYTTYYYRIPVNRKFYNDNNSKLCLKRNNMYKISINIGVLGSTDPSTPVTINNAAYKIMDWGLLPIDAAIRDYKYLVVDQKEISIYNIADAQITFASSNDVKVTIDKIEYKYYGLATTRTVTITSNDKSVEPPAANFSDNNVYADYKLNNANQDLTSGEVTEVTLAKDTKVIDFSHQILDNTYVPHKIYLTVKHTDDTTGEYEEQVKITQYPPIYIIGAQSNGKVFVNGKTSNPTDDKGGGLGSITTNISGDDNAVNQNKNQYDVYVTVLPSSDYLIGDPREPEGSSLAGIGELTNYKATRIDAVNVIAPVFKIASSYGKTTQFNYAAAQKRCASYQENGYPAGRWRIPTPAEIEFMQQRALNGDIPSLFNGTSNSGYRGYWAANETVYWPGYDANGNGNYGPEPGFYTPGNDNMSSSSHSVRCVYDVWYWGNENTGQVADQNANYQLTNPVWGDTGSVTIMEK